MTFDTLKLLVSTTLISPVDSDCTNAALPSGRNATLRGRGFTFK